MSQKRITDVLGDIILEDPAPEPTEVDILGKILGKIFWIES